MIKKIFKRFYHYWCLYIDTRPITTYRYLVRFGYIKSDFTPLKCTRCECEKFESKIIDSIGYTTMEEKFICKECQSFIGYWVTGGWENYLV